MNLLVLGATGGCGTLICQQALQRGHRVRALVRSGSQSSLPPEVEIQVGDVLNKDSLLAALEGIDGILSGLGIKRESPKNPWSATISPPDLTTRVAKHLVTLMPGMNIRKVITISAAGVGESSDRVNPVIRWMINNSNMAVSYRDLEEMERVFRESTLQWMAVRPTTLTNQVPTGRAQKVNHYGLFDRIPRGDVAAWMLDAIESDSQPTDRTPMISS